MPLPAEIRYVAVLNELKRSACQVFILCLIFLINSDFV